MGRVDTGSSLRRVRFLTLARLVLLGLSFGLSVAALVMLVLGVVRLVTGSEGQLQGGLSVLVPAGAALIAARLGIPRIDRELLDRARRAEGPALCMPLIDLLNSPAVGLRAAPFEAELVRLLATVDEPWWQANGRELREQVAHAFDSGHAPSALRPAGTAWLGTLFDAMARFGRTEHVPLLEGLVRAAAKHRVDPDAAHAARNAVQVLRERKRQEQLAATLLRPAEPPGAEALLRPASVEGGPGQERLLRPAGDGEAPLPAPHADTEPEHVAAVLGGNAPGQGEGAQR